MKPIQMVTVPAGVPVADTNPLQYVPLFSMKELGAMTPELQLERIRAFHCAYGQYDQLERLDDEVERNGNPYQGKPLKALLAERA